MHNAKQPAKWRGIAPSRVMARKDHVAALVKEAILTGKLKPGERIVEMELSKQLGIGNTAVREALFELQSQGYVARQANRGTFVTELTPADAEQIFVVRRALEGLAAELAERRMSKASRTELERHMEAMQTAAAKRELDTFSQADLRFHQAIWALSGNHFLEETLVTIVGPLFAVFVMRDRSVTREQLSRSCEHHRRILESLAQGSGSRQVMEDSLQFFLRQQMDTTFGSHPQKEGKTDTAPGAATAATAL